MTVSAHTEKGETMSLYIKGLDMPKDCVGLSIVIHTENNMSRPIIIYKKDIIEIPHPHGRLIDIDEVPKYNIVSRPLREGWNEALKYIDEFAPTILEAE